MSKLLVSDRLHMSLSRTNLHLYVPEIYSQLFHYTMSACRMRSLGRCCVRSGGSPSYLLDVSG
jgi:hypothetical protein